MKALISLAAKLAVIALPVALACCDSDSPPSSAFQGTEVDPARPAPDFSAPNRDGTVFRLSDHRGKVVVLVFGYTYCPDVCPFTLRRLAKAHKQLGELAKDTVVAFVSVDPERDSAEKLQSYLPSFDPEFHGLRPVGEEMAALLKDYGIKVTKQTPSVAGGYYAVDHTGDHFLIDKAGQLRVTHPHDTTVEALQADLESLLREPSS